MVKKEHFEIAVNKVLMGNSITSIKEIQRINFLEIFENIGTHHADIAGYGPNDIKRTGVTWVLLDWKVQVLTRPKYVCRSYLRFISLSIRSEPLWKGKCG